jgi:UDP-N-acetylmuramate--alanine ligase
MSEKEIEQINKIHFVGIGGIGMSALARLFLGLGKEVTGSDLKETEITESLEKEGIKIFYKQESENITSDIDVVVYTLAVSHDNLELVATNNLGIKKFYYAEMLGMVSKNFYTIAISGTHGKTTTTAMLAKAFEEAKQSPNVIVGSIISDFGTNYIKGNSDFFIVEACEYKRSFLNLYPKILIITNLEEDHLDYYKDLIDIQSAFHELAFRVPEDGFIICDLQDEKIKPVIKDVNAKIINYKDFISEVPKLKIPGEHNIMNAATVLSVANVLNLNKNDIKKGLENFSGTWRRFQFIKETENKNLFYDDYAHHPTEILATIKGFREKFPNYELNIIFQPHLYSRTKELLNDFVKVLSLADKIILLPIYAAREILDPSISSLILSQKISAENLKDSEHSENSKSIYLENFESVKNWIKENDHNKTKQIFVSMGAGDVYKIWET